MIKYNLYGSEGCHLCEQALAICLNVLSTEQLVYIDIIEQERVEHETQTLFELYGVHIPVLEKLAQNSNENTKLFWPFTQAQVTQLVNDNLIS
ncbi:glutaredoxin family protein [Colwellia ponticola]|uniref:Thioredoxin family protein n=1 Tax=Colwellia ponticola TaxID=2304625 RepID=A0A8H2JIY3_9GAMM|nr:glutaredoxin family protein [Colwellia ponticola]TMM42391.1 thioredoxin family protein [Colwellia ponticola]